MSSENLIKRKREEIVRSSVETTNQSRAKLAKTNDSEQETALAEEVYSTENTSTNVSSARREILLEALKRIIELQNELDDFENDLDANAEYEEASWHRRQQQQHQQLQQEEEEDAATSHRRSEAEALGFAMCARETLTFLQHEGIPSNSLIYRTLKEKLTGQTDEVIPI